MITILKTQIKIGAKLFGQVLGKLPIPISAHLKHGVMIVGALDYPDSNIRMEVDSPNEVIRLRACAKESETVAWIESYIHDGDVLYDIGANVGAYSLLTRGIHNNIGKVYAFEPGFSNFASLCRNVILNRWQDSIFPFQIALTDKTDLIPFQYSSIEPGAAEHDSMLKEKNGNITPTNKIIQRVIGYGLDDFINTFDLSKPNHIKIDVDGAELAVLCGARLTLSYPELTSILIEINENNAQSNLVYKILEEYGFKVTQRHLRPGHTKLYNCIFTKLETQVKQTIM